MTDNNHENANEDRLKDNFETVYQVHHMASGGFGGNTTIWIAVEEETDGEIRGRRFSPMMTLPGERVTVRKDNLAGWGEDKYRYRKIPEEWPQQSVEDVQRAYRQGRIDEEELEEGIEKALTD